MYTFFCFYYVETQKKNTKNKYKLCNIGHFGRKATGREAERLRASEDIVSSLFPDRRSGNVTNILFRLVSIYFKALVQSISLLEAMRIDFNPPLVPILSLSMLEGKQ